MSYEAAVQLLNHENLLAPTIYAGDIPGNLDTTVQRLVKKCRGKRKRGTPEMYSGYSRNHPGFPNMPPTEEQLVLACKVYQEQHTQSRRSSRKRGSV
mmetsp:Transcript_22128/g.69238  ORF Transcript_22128/g.69238 Transcript_22128/m.69238 type:complete len:97 (+) Transcript_22128:707-997(+)